MEDSVMYYMKIDKDHDTGKISTQLNKPVNANMSLDLIATLLMIKSVYDSLDNEEEQNVFLERLKKGINEDILDNIDKVFS